MKEERREWQAQTRVYYPGELPRVIEPGMVVSPRNSPYSKWVTKRIERPEDAAPLVTIQDLASTQGVVLKVTLGHLREAWVLAEEWEVDLG